MYKASRGCSWHLVRLWSLTFILHIKYLHIVLFLFLFLVRLWSVWPVGTSWCVLLLRRRCNTDNHCWCRARCPNAIASTAVRRRRQLAGNHISAHITRPDQTNNHRRGRSRDCEKNKGGVSGLVDKDIPLLPGFLSFRFPAAHCLAPAPLKLRPYGAIQMRLLLLLFLFFLPQAV